MSKHRAKRLALSTEVLRTLSSRDLDSIGGGAGSLRDLLDLVLSRITCFGASGLCHGPDSEAVRRQKVKQPRRALLASRAASEPR